MSASEGVLDIQQGSVARLVSSLGDCGVHGEQKCVWVDAKETIVTMTNGLDASHVCLESDQVH